MKAYLMGHGKTLEHSGNSTMAMIPKGMTFIPYAEEGADLPQHLGLSIISAEISTGIGEHQERTFVPNMLFGSLETVELDRLALVKPEQMTSKLYVITDQEQKNLEGMEKIPPGLKLCGMPFWCGNPTNQGMHVCNGVLRILQDAGVTKFQMATCRGLELPEERNSESGGPANDETADEQVVQKNLEGSSDLYDTVKEYSKKFGTSGSELGQKQLMQQEMLPHATAAMLEASEYLTAQQEEFYGQFTPEGLAEFTSALAGMKEACPADFLSCSADPEWWELFWGWLHYQEKGDQWSALLNCFSRLQDAAADPPQSLLELTASTLDLDDLASYWTAWGLNSAVDVVELIERCDRVRYYDAKLRMLIDLGPRHESPDHWNSLISELDGDTDFRWEVQVSLDTIDEHHLPELQNVLMQTHQSVTRHASSRISEYLDAEFAVFRHAIGL
ncbi:hypothetical protein EES43_16750 [Streptomyces sp. ADI96-02]|uniref:hypothetical protein n=1 Tax=Streptomyces sp. ADI96-02 TaxID=1522760 RepID=UPI000F551D44|nr:hypothetical protein [Streptomyces sp. ADI96-02]RPK60769.1 hypothetical protein EES43_16750 [Streptomyces sp. ADI96-02]